MEETISLIFHGCKLAKELESNLLQNLANHQPTMNLSSSCDDLVRVFSAARDQLIKNIQYPQSSIEGLDDQVVGDQGIQEWLLKYNSTQLGFGAAMGRRELGGRDGEGSLQLKGGGEEAPPLKVADQDKASSSRRRKNDADKRTVWVPAPQMGNTEIPPEDGYTWRKYGQKEILGSRFLRGYYRCTHQKLYNCPAKKQVQRLNSDPYTFEVTYRGDHTCFMSSTAPSIPPPPSTPPPPQPISAQLGRWLSMDINPTGEISPNNTLINQDMNLYRDFGLISTAGPRTGSDGAGPSGSRFGRDPDYQLVADLADVMFNSGSSGNNSMELIFSSMEDKWEQGDNSDKKH